MKEKGDLFTRSPGNDISMQARVDPSFPFSMLLCFARLFAVTDSTNVYNATSTVRNSYTVGAWPPKGLRSLRTDQRGTGPTQTVYAGPIPRPSHGINSPLSSFQISMQKFPKEDFTREI